MAENQLNRQLAAGVRAARQGDSERARELLEGVLRQDRNNEQAWIWMASVVESSRERRLSLERVLKINPNNQPAQDALNSMVGVLGAGEDRTIDYEGISAAARTPVPSRGGGGGGRPQAAGGAGGSGTNWVPLLGIVVVVLGLLLAGSLFLPQFLQPEPTEIPTQVAEAVEVTEEPTVDPSITPPTSTIVPSATFDGTRVAVTSILPDAPTFTPTAPPTATDEPTATNTLPPRSDYGFLIMGIQGSATISLYRIDGGGDNLQTLISNVSDFDYNPESGLLVYTRRTFVDVPTLEPTLTNTPVPLSPTPTNTPIVPQQATSEGGGGFVLQTSGTTQDPLDELQVKMYIATLDDPEDFTEITSSALPSAFAPSISPDGNFIAFSSANDGDTEIYLYNVETGLSTQLTRNDSFEDIDPDWSPDGSRLIFSSDRDRPTNNDIYVMDPFADDPESTVEQITDSRGRNIEPQWSPVADEIVYLNVREGETTLRYATIDGLIVRDLTFDPTWNYSAPSWTPDGNYVLFSSSEPDARALEFRIYSPTTRTQETIRVINVSVLQIVPR